MKHQIPDAIIKQATKCQHSSSCLETGKCGDKEMCAVDYTDGENVIFLKDKQEACCSYRMPFGYSQVCSCPVHYAIRRKQA